MIECPVCKAPFTVAKMRTALDGGCLEYPIAGGFPRVNMLRNWAPSEQEQESKKRCLQELASPQVLQIQNARRLQRMHEMRQIIDNNAPSAVVLPRRRRLGNAANRMVVTPSDYFETLGGLSARGQRGDIAKKMPCLQQSSIMALILNAPAVRDTSMPQEYRNPAGNWTNFNQLATVQLAVNGLTRLIQNHISSLLSAGSALQEVILTSETAVRSSDTVRFLLTELGKRIAPILRLRLPMLLHDHIDYYIFEFLAGKPLLQELCVPIRRLLPAALNSYLQHLPKVYPFPEIYLGSACNATRHRQH